MFLIFWVKHCFFLKLSTFAFFWGGKQNMDLSKFVGQNFGLAKYKNTEWQVDSYLVTTCICVNIVCSALKDSLLANSELLKRSDSQENFDQNNILDV